VTITYGSDVTGFDAVRVGRGMPRTGQEEMEKAGKPGFPRNGRERARKKGESGKAGVPSQWEGTGQEERRKRVVG
jgi:hypothetical protein